MEATFDTLAYAERLKAAGIDHAHATAHAEALRAAFHEGVATKADIARLEARIERAETRALFALIAVAAVIIAAVRYL